MQNLVKISILHENKDELGRGDRKNNVNLRMRMHMHRLTLVSPVRIQEMFVKCATCLGHPCSHKKGKGVFLADVLKVTTHWAASCGSRDEKNDLILYSTCHRDADYNANHFCWYNKTYMWRMDQTNYCCLNLSGRTCQQRFFSCLTEM